MTIITGTSANDNLIGTPSADTLNGLGGTNILDGGNGDDTYVVDLTSFAGRETNIYNTIHDLGGTGDTLQEFGVNSLAELNNQINAGTNAHILVGATQDSLGTHSYLYIY